MGLSVEGELGGVNDDGCDSRAREQRLALAFIGGMVKEEGMRAGREAGSSGRAGSSRGARPDAAGAERPSKRGVCGRSRASAMARARCVLEWGGDGARQGSSWVAVGQRARAVQRRSECGARVLCRARREEERGRESKGGKVNYLTRFKFKIIN